jgi:predicted SprT family Zn-dependent metalloprotease
MRLVEIFLKETTEEDRAIISLAQAIFQDVEKLAKKEEPEDPAWYDHEDPGYDDSRDIADLLREKKEPEIIHLGKIGGLYDTPLTALNNIKIDLQDGASLDKRASNEPEKYVEQDSDFHTVGVWLPDEKTISLNKDYLNTPKRKAHLRSVVAHELRHALDDVKSKFKATSSKSYMNPRTKFQKSLPTDADKTRAQPIEINARFVELLNSLVPAIKYAVNNLQPEEIRGYIMKELQEGLVHHQLADLFPEKEKSPQYKRLMKRVVDFVQKEVKHQFEIKKSK